MCKEKTIDFRTQITFLNDSKRISFHIRGMSFKNNNLYRNWAFMH